MQNKSPCPGQLMSQGSGAQSPVPGLDTARGTMSSGWWSFPQVQQFGSRKAVAALIVPELRELTLPCRWICGVFLQAVKRSQTRALDPTHGLKPTRSIWPVRQPGTTSVACGVGRSLVKGHLYTAENMLLLALCSRSAPKPGDSG